MVTKPDYNLSDDKDALLSKIEQLKKDVKRLKMERDLLEGAAELIKKDRASVCKSCRTKRRPY